MAVRIDSQTDNYIATNGPVGTTFSAVAWAYLIASPIDYSMILAWENAATSASQYIDLGMGPSRDLQIYSNGGAVSTGYTVPFNTWIRVGIVVNGGTGTIYWGTDSGTLSSNSSTISNGTRSHFFVGSDSWTNEWLNGRIAGVKVWQAALSAAEIESELSQYMPQRTANLLRWHPFVNAETVDYSGNGFALTAGAGTATTEDGPPIRWARSRSPRIRKSSTSQPGSAAATLGGLTATATGTRRTAGSATAALGALSATATGAAYLLAETLTDDFDDNTVNTAKWPFNYGTVSETGGQARVTALANGNGSGYEAPGKYQIAGSSLLAKVTPPSPENSTFAYAALSMYDIDSGYTTYLEAYHDSVPDGDGHEQLGFYSEVNGVTVIDTVFDLLIPGAADWMRVREDSGTLYFDISANGTTWENSGSWPTPPAIAASRKLTIDLEARRSSGSSGAGTAAAFDNLNLAPSFASVTGTATAALGGLTGSATGIRTVRASAAAAPLGGLAASTTSRRTSPGTATANLGALASAATGVRRTAGSAAAGLGGIAGAATGRRTTVAAAAAALGGLGATAAGVREATATATSGLGALTSTAIGARSTTSAGIANLGALSASTAGTRTDTGAATAPLGALSATATAVVEVRATSSAPLGAIAATAAGHRLRSGDAAASLGALAATAAGRRTLTAAATASLGGLTAAAAAVRSTLAAAVAALEALVATATGVVTGAGTGAGQAPLGPLAATATGTRTTIGAADAPLGPLAAATTGHPNRGGVATASLGTITASATAVGAVTATATAQLGELTSAGIGRVTVISSADAPLGTLDAAASGVAGGSAVATADLGGLAAAAVGVRDVPGMADAELGDLVSAATSVSTRIATAYATLGPLTSTAAAPNAVTGVAVAPLGALVAVGVGGNLPDLSWPLHAAAVRDTPQHQARVTDLAGLCGTAVSDTGPLHATAITP